MGLAYPVQRVLTGAALVTGYGLLGACWLIWRTEGDLQRRMRGNARLLGLATLGFVAAVSLPMPFLNEVFRARWFTFPAILYASPIPILVLLLAWRFLRALDRREHLAPFLCALGVFLLSYVGLGVSMWPMIVPPSITIWQAASPPASQLFLLIGAAVLIPLILVYTGYVYWLFRGKVQLGAGYH